MPKHIGLFTSQARHGLFPICQARSLVCDFARQIRTVHGNRLKYQAGRHLAMPYFIVYMISIYSYGVRQAHDSNVFNYNAFDRDDVSSVAGGMHVINTVSPMSGARMVDDNRRRQAATVSALSQSSMQIFPQFQGMGDARSRNINSTNNVASK